MKSWLKLYLLPGLLLLLSGQPLFAQELSGKILDELDKGPVVNVIVRNKTTNDIVYSDNTGAFKINAYRGDSILFISQGYGIFKMKMGDHSITDQVVILKRKTISLNEVVIQSGLTPYQIDSVERRETYKGTLDQKKTRSVMSPVSLLADRISRKSRQKWRFQKNFASWEEQKYIDTRYGSDEVSDLTGLKGDSLAAFMNAYPMNYEYARTASDLEIKMWIRYNYREWKKNPYVPDLSKLSGVDTLKDPFGTGN